MEMGCNTLAESRVNGRGVWLYEVIAPIGTIYVVDYEREDFTICRIFFDEDQKEKATRLYSNHVKNIAKGTL